MAVFYNVLSNITLTDILIGLLSITCIYVIHFYYKYFTRVNPVPGPTPIPLIGSFSIFTEELDTWIWRLSKKYGHDGIFEANIAGERLIYICCAEYVDALVTVNNNAHFRRTTNRGLLDLFDLDKRGVSLNNDYEIWKFNRPIFMQALVPLSLTDKPCIIINKLYEDMTQCWINLKQPGNKGVIIDMPAWMHRFAADFIAMLTAGKQMSIVKHYAQKLKNEPLTEEILGTEEFIRCVNNFGIDNQMIFVPKKLRNFPFIKPRVDRLLKDCNLLYKKLTDIIKERRREVEKAITYGELNTKQMDLLTTLIITNTQYDPNPQDNIDPSLARPLTDDEIRGFLFDAFFAGTETTVNTFCFALYYISHNPEIKKKLLEELETVFKGDPNRPITLEDVTKLKYVEAIIKETSRIRPAVSIVSRHSTRPDKIAGRTWPAGTIFIMHIRGINNNPLYWEKPDKFIPERFYGNQGIHKNSFPMFGGGPRVCPGQKIAMIEMKALLAAIYRRFDVELENMQAPLKIETSTVTICKELNVRVTPKERII